jgi:hypothetical protein
LENDGEDARQGEHRATGEINLAGDQKNGQSDGDDPDGRAAVHSQAKGCHVEKAGNAQRGDDQRGAENDDDAMARDIR